MRTDEAITDWVGPILVLDPSEQLSREEARVRLGIGPDELAVLVAPGVVFREEEWQRLRAFASVSRRLMPAVRFFVLGPFDHLSPLEPLTWFPAMQVMRAFDAAVSAGGYNTVHELLASSVPTVLFPRPTVYDDQPARIRRLSDEGVCLALDGDAPGERLAEAADELLARSDLRARLARGAAQAVRTGGAARAATLILDRWAARPT
jgi:UDP-N-acetylglucosamine--N-acetylmuramyl-(pentapeptide) pyrophosphoryl-undecaprenol N-acetylglucosamine transferase